MCTQVAVNRSRLRGVVQKLLQDIPHQRGAAQRREDGIELARRYHNVWATPLALAQAYQALHDWRKPPAQLICLHASQVPISSEQLHTRAIC